MTADSADLESLRYLVDGVGTRPGPGGWNRIHRIVEDIAAKVDRLRPLGVRFHSGAVTGPGGRQIVVDDPSGNPVELLQPVAR